MTVPQGGHRGSKFNFSTRHAPLNKLSRLQVYEVHELYLSGEAAPLVLSRLGLRVELERDVIQLAALCLPD